METLLYTLYETPWWVYILFFYLMAIGWKASKRSTLHITCFIRCLDHHENFRSTQGIGRYIRT